MTKRKISNVVSCLTGCSAVSVNVDLICNDALVRPFDIEEIDSEFGYLVVYLKGYWTVHGENIRVKLKNKYHYISGKSY